MEDESITFQELIDDKLSTRLEFADRILDDLFAAIDASDSQKAKEAKRVLENWDRTADADSKGMLLFYRWARKFEPGNGSNYVLKWSSQEPSTTPDGIADPKRAISLLEESVEELNAKFGRLDLPWGDYYRINYNGTNLPANGVDGSMGVFRVAWPGGSDDDHMYVGGGDSWVGVIEFGDQVKAKVLLSYGNATQADSPHNGDQLVLFSKKELRDAWFSKTEVEANTVRIEVLTPNGFVKEK
jgi:acyl-homoserine-lactone acylase